MFGLTEEQQAIVGACRQYADRELAPNAVTWDRDRTFPISTIRRAAALGLGGICVRDDVGGSGLTRLDAVLAFEALATGCPTIAAYISIHNMVAWMIDQAGNDEQRKRWLPDLCAMSALGSYCLTEPGTGSDAAALTTRAVRSGDGYQITGVKQFISGAGATDVYVVLARTSDDGSHGISAFVVERDTPGLSFGSEESKMGWHAQPTRQVILERVQVSAECRLGVEGDGFRLALRGLTGGRLTIAACSLGGAQTAFEKAVSYLRQRRAFGAALIDSQALQFELAELATDLQASRSLLWRAAAALDGGDPQGTELVAMAKRFVTDRCFDVANRALQLHGGYGYLADHGVEKIVRDLRVHQILEGTNEVMKMIIARSIVRS